VVRCGFVVVHFDGLEVASVGGEGIFERAEEGHINRYSCQSPCFEPGIELDVIVTIYPLLV
jgi:hypothetical protein